MRKIQSKEGAFKKTREKTAPIEVQQAVEDTQEPVPAEDSSADGNTNKVCTVGEVEAPTGAMAGDNDSDKLQVMISSTACQVVVLDGVSEGDLFRVKLTPEVQHLLLQSDVEELSYAPIFRAVGDNLDCQS